jgi:molybdopterin-synthase adenylyltransferase
VGKLTVIDDDKISLSNLQRQVLHATLDIGRPKTESAADLIQRLNPHVQVETRAERLNANNARSLLQVRRQEGDQADDLFTKLMGDIVEPRREFIQANALSVANLDV